MTNFSYDSGGNPQPYYEVAPPGPNLPATPLAGLFDGTDPTALPDPLTPWSPPSSGATNMSTPLGSPTAAPSTPFGALPAAPSSGQPNLAGAIVNSMFAPQAQAAPAPMPPAPTSLGTLNAYQQSLMQQQYGPKTADPNSLIGRFSNWENKTLPSWASAGINSAVESVVPGGAGFAGQSLVNAGLEKAGLTGLQLGARGLVSAAPELVAALAAGGEAATEGAAIGAVAGLGVADEVTIPLGAIIGFVGGMLGMFAIQGAATAAQNKLMSSVTGDQNWSAWQQQRAAEDKANPVPALVGQFTGMGMFLGPNVKGLVSAAGLAGDFLKARNPAVFAITPGMDEAEKAAKQFALANLVNVGVGASTQAGLTIWNQIQQGQFDGASLLASTIGGAIFNHPTKLLGEKINNFGPQIFKTDTYVAQQAAEAAMAKQVTDSLATAKATLDDHLSQGENATARAELDSKVHDATVAWNTKVEEARAAQRDGNTKLAGQLEEQAKSLGLSVERMKTADMLSGRIDPLTPTQDELPLTATTADEAAAAQREQAQPPHAVENGFTGPLKANEYYAAVPNVNASMKEIGAQLKKTKSSSTNGDLRLTEHPEVAQAHAEAMRKQAEETGAVTTEPGISDKALRSVPGVVVVRMKDGHQTISLGNKTTGPLADQGISPQTGLRLGRHEDIHSIRKYREKPTADKYAQARAPQAMQAEAYSPTAPVGAHVQTFDPSPENVATVRGELQSINQTHPELKAATDNMSAALDLAERGRGSLLTTRDVNAQLNGAASFHWAQTGNHIEIQSIGSVQAHAGTRLLTEIARTAASHDKGLIVHPPPEAARDFALLGFKHVGNGDYAMTAEQTRDLVDRFDAVTDADGVVNTLPTRHFTKELQDMQERMLAHARGGPQAEQAMQDVLTHGPEGTTNTQGAPHATEETTSNTSEANGGSEALKALEAHAFGYRSEAQDRSQERTGQDGHGGTQSTSDGAQAEAQGVHASDAAERATDGSGTASGNGSGSTTDATTGHGGTASTDAGGTTDAGRPTTGYGPTGGTTTGDGPRTATGTTGSDAGSAGPRSTGGTGANGSPNDTSGARAGSIHSSSFERDDAGRAQEAASSTTGHGPANERNPADAQQSTEAGASGGTALDNTVTDGSVKITGDYSSEMGTMLNHVVSLLKATGINDNNLINQVHILDLGGQGKKGLSDFNFRHMVGVDPQVILKQVEYNHNVKLRDTLQSHLERYRADAANYAHVPQFSEAIAGIQKALDRLAKETDVDALYRVIGHEMFHPQIVEALRNQHELALTAADPVHFPSGYKLPVPVMHAGDEYSDTRFWSEQAIRMYHFMDEKMLGGEFAGVNMGLAEEVKTLGAFYKAVMAANGGVLPHEIPPVDFAQHGVDPAKLVVAAHLIDEHVNYLLMGGKEIGDGFSHATDDTLAASIWSPKEHQDAQTQATGWLDGARPSAAEAPYLHSPTTDLHEFQPSKYADAASDAGRIGDATTANQAGLVQAQQAMAVARLTPEGVHFRATMLTRTSKAMAEVGPRGENETPADYAHRVAVAGGYKTVEHAVAIQAAARTGDYSYPSTEKNGKVSVVLDGHKYPGTPRDQVDGWTPEFDLAIQGAPGAVVHESNMHEAVADNGFPIHGDEIHATMADNAADPAAVAEAAAKAQAEFTGHPSDGPIALLDAAIARNKATLKQIKAMKSGDPGYWHKQSSLQDVNAKLKGLGMQRSDLAKQRAEDVAAHLPTPPPPERTDADYVTETQMVHDEYEQGQLGLNLAGDGGAGIFSDNVSATTDANLGAEPKVPVGAGGGTPPLDKPPTTSGTPPEEPPAGKNWNPRSPSELADQIGMIDGWSYNKQARDVMNTRVKLSNFTQSMNEARMLPETKDIALDLHQILITAHGTGQFETISAHPEVWAIRNVNALNEMNLRMTQVGEKIKTLFKTLAAGGDERAIHDRIHQAMETGKYDNLSPVEAAYAKVRADYYAVTGDMAERNGMLKSALELFLPHLLLDNKGRSLTAQGHSVVTGSTSQIKRMADKAGANLWPTLQEFTDKFGKDNVMWNDADIFLAHGRAWNEALMMNNFIKKGMTDLMMPVRADGDKYSGPIIVTPAKWKGLAENKSELRTITKGPYETALAGKYVVKPVADRLERLASVREEEGPIAGLAKLVTSINGVFKEIKFIGPMHMWSMMSQIASLTSKRGYLGLPPMLDGNVYGRIGTGADIAGHSEDFLNSLNPLWKGAMKERLAQALRAGIPPPTATGEDMQRAMGVMERMPGVAGDFAHWWHDMMWRRVGYHGMLGVWDYLEKDAVAKYTKQYGVPSATDLAAIQHSAADQARQALGFLTNMDMTKNYNMYSNMLLLASKWTTAQLRVAGQAFGIKALGNLGGRNDFALGSGKAQAIIAEQQGQMARKLMFGGLARLAMTSLVIGGIGSTLATGSPSTPIQNFMRDPAHTFDIYTGRDAATNTDRWVHLPLYMFQREFMDWAMASVKNYQDGKPMDNPVRAAEIAAQVPIRFFSKANPVLRTSLEAMIGTEFGKALNGYGDAAQIDNDKSIQNIHKSLDSLGIGMPTWAGTIENRLIYAIRSVSPFSVAFPVNPTGQGQDKMGVGDILNALGPGTYDLRQPQNIAALFGARFDKGRQFETDPATGVTRPLSAIMLDATNKKENIQHMIDAMKNGDVKTADTIRQQLGLSPAQFKEYILFGSTSSTDKGIYAGAPTQQGVSSPQNQKITQLLGQDLTLAQQNTYFNIQIQREEQVMQMVMSAPNWKTMNGSDHQALGAQWIAYADKISQEQYAQTLGIRPGTPISNKQADQMIVDAVRLEANLSNALLNNSSYKALPPREQSLMMAERQAAAKTAIWQANVGTLKGFTNPQLEDMVNMQVGVKDSVRNYVKTLSGFTGAADIYSAQQYMTKAMTWADQMVADAYAQKKADKTLNHPLQPAQVWNVVKNGLALADSATTMMHKSSVYAEATPAEQTSLDNKYATLAHRIALLDQQNGVDLTKQGAIYQQGYGQAMQTRLMADEGYKQLTDTFGGQAAITKGLQEVAALKKQFAQQKGVPQASLAKYNVMIDAWYAQNNPQFGAFIKARAIWESRNPIGQLYAAFNRDELQYAAAVDPIAQQMQDQQNTDQAATDALAAANAVY